MKEYNPNLLEAARTLPVVCLPDQRLYTPSSDVEMVDDEVRDIMHNMLRTMYLNNGIGLTAVQVGIMKKIIVIDIDQIGVPESFKSRDSSEKKPEVQDETINNELQKEKNLVHKGTPIFMINPRIVEFGPENQTFNEGCLSIPYVDSKVTRPSTVRVIYLGYNGEERDEWFGPGLLSSCVQHEIDHANGRLFWDNINPIVKNQLERKMLKLIREERRKKKI